MKLKLLIASAYVLAVGQIALAQTNENNNLANYLLNCPFKMPAVTAPNFNAKVFKVTDYGAVGDGQTLNTTAFEKTISACNAAGGGTVLVPAGLWLTGPIVLKSNVNFHAERGALIIFSTDHSLYPVSEGKVQVLLSGNNLENVGITGEGIYDGGGDTWRPLKKTKAAPTLWSDMVKSGGAVSKDGSMYWPTKQAMDGEAYLKTLKGKPNLTAADYLPARDYLRPTMVSVTNSKNVIIDGPTFKNSPQFALNPKNCVGMIIRNVTINNEYYAQNGDGIDLSSCKNIIVYHCTVNAGDDGICMKSSGGKPGEAGLENVLVADCIVYHAHGGFVIGSNTDGGMHNVYVTNCNFVNTDIGIRIKSSRGRGGLVHDIYIDKIYMRDILNEAILFNTYYEDNVKETVATAMPVTDKTPRFQDFFISNIFCNNAKTAISIVGLPEMPVSRVNLSNVVISANEPIAITDAQDIVIKNSKILSPAATLVQLTNAQAISIDNMAFAKDASTFIAADGAKTKDVKVSNTNLKDMTSPFKLGTLDKSIISVQ